MGDSSLIVVSHNHETELRELDRTPLVRSPLRLTPARAAPQSPSKTSQAIDRTLSGAASLAQLLPSGTVLAFQTLSPSFANKGTCYPANRYLTAALLLSCILSCVFFTFTDSLIGRDGKLYYGLATFKSFYVFNWDFRAHDEDRSMVLGNLERFRIRFLDYVHSLFSVLVFVALSLSDADVQACFFPHAGNNTKELLVNLPLGLGFISTVVFMVFPTSRKGIGYSDALPHSR